MSLTMLDTLRKENGGAPIRAVLYARYSSDMQREESIEAQVKAICEFAKKENIIIIKQYVDKALSGTSDDRPDFQQMISDSKLQNFQLVLVHKADRFSRDTYDSVVYRHILRNHGVRFLAVAQPLDEDKPEDKLLDTLLTAMASYYSDNLKNEVLKGLRLNAERALHTGGTPPLGYNIGPDKKLVINETEAEAVRIIFSMIIAGKKYGEILQELRINGYKTKTGKEFGKNSLNTILHNQKYTGDFIYNRTCGKDPLTRKRNSHKERPKDEQIIVKDAIPAIISREEFEKVQSLLTKRKRFAHTCESTYLLTGKIYCGVCTCSYNGNCKRPNKNRLTQNPTYTYRCSNRSNKINKNICDNKEINRDHLETFILSQIEKLIFSPEIISNTISRFQNYAIQRQTESNKKLQKMETAIKTLEQELENLTDKYIATDNPDLQLRIDKRIQERERLKKETEKSYEEEKALVQVTIPTKKHLTMFFNKAKEQFRNKTLEELHELVDLIVEKVIVFKNHVEITYNFMPGVTQDEYMKTHVKVTREEIRLCYLNQTSYYKQKN